MICVVIVDEQTLVRGLLELVPDMEVLGEASLALAGRTVRNHFQPVAEA